MAFTFNGFGTRFYGWSGVRGDGSYIVTEWITALYLPVIPLRSLRVRPGRGVNLVVFRSKSYQILERVPLYWPQVARAYLLLAFWAASIWAFSKTKLLDRQDAGGCVLFLLTFMALPLVAPVLWPLVKARLGRKARRNARSAPEAQPVAGPGPATESPRAASGIAPRKRFNSPRN